MSKTVHLGYEVDTGQPVEIPIRHMAVTGQTQESGKTTTLEALVARAGLPAVTFITKRGEGAFVDGRRVAPYFRDRADWQFVDGLLTAVLQEKNKFLRPWLMKVCRTTNTLAEVHAEVRKALKKAKGFNEGIYTQLDAYLDLIVPEIGKLPPVAGLELGPGLNVMDLSRWSTPVQMLFVQSAIDWINEREAGIITVVPEAWEMIPEGKGSPVKQSAITLVRKGAALPNHIWVDSQDMAGVDKVILRGCAVWLIGVQREANEIKRNLSNIPASVKRPKPSEVALLERGQFFACWGQHCIRTYVQPAWMTAGEASAIAMGAPPLPRKQVPAPPPKPKEIEVTPAEAAELRAANARLTEEVAALTRKLANLTTPTEPSRPTAALMPPAVKEFTPEQSLDNEALYQAFKARLMSEAPQILVVLAEKQEIRVEIERKTMEIDGSSLKGRLARLIASGFFDEGCAQVAAKKELERTGPQVNGGNLSTTVNGLVKDGFLTSEPGNLYRAAPRMKVNIVDKAA